MLLLRSRDLRASLLKAYFFSLRGYSNPSEVKGKKKKKKIKGQERGRERRGEQGGESGKGKDR